MWNSHNCLRFWQPWAVGQVTSGAHTTRVGAGFQSGLDVVPSSPQCCFPSWEGLQFEISLLQLIVRQCGRAPGRGGCCGGCVWSAMAPWKEKHVRAENGSSAVTRLEWVPFQMSPFTREKKGFYYFIIWKHVAWSKAQGHNRNLKHVVLAIAAAGVIRLSHLSAL